MPNQHKHPMMITDTLTRAMTAEEAELLAAVGRHLWRATLIGNAPPAIMRLYGRMSHPQPGDLVLEVTKFGPFDPNGIGWLLRVEGDEPDKRRVVRPLCRPDAEQGWQNARFVALPDRRKWLDDPFQPPGK